MRLSTRLSAFFLAALALVLVGFSGSLYILAGKYLNQQLDERLQQSLDTLEASIDIEPGGLEWEPADRRMALGLDQSPDAPRWSVRDGAGKLVDLSANARGIVFPDLAPSTRKARIRDGSTFTEAPGWRLATRKLQLTDLLRQGRGHPNDEPGYEVQYATLVLAVGLSPAPVTETLGRLRLVLVVLSALIWATSAVIGRGLCERALSPVGRMARAASVMTVADLDQKLPIPGTGDELDALGQAYNGMLGRLQDGFERLNHAYDCQRRYAGDASHQLRTPLAAILGQVQVTLRRERSADEYRRTLELVREEGVRLKAIVETLLLLARPEELTSEDQDMDLRAWAADHLKRWAGHARADDLRFVADDLAPTVRGHPFLMGQVLDNLIENAIQYSPPGSRITVRVAVQDGQAALEVEDQGAGMPPEDLHRAFDPFFRSDQARQGGHRGVGLGLAVARRVAESLGGTLEARSQPGAGSVFSLRLPAGS